MSTQEQLPPNYRRLDTALRSIGYSFEIAVADIVDNSIDATAGVRGNDARILVRLVITRKGKVDLVVWDNGRGMDNDNLREAMRFGADVSTEIHRLGKFGLGLKLASLSQARELRVVSFADGHFSGRAWLEHGIADGFTCTIYDESESRKLVSEVVPDRKFTPSGTLVWWSDLYRVGTQHSDPEEHAQKLMRRLETHLALAFHRFLSGRPRQVSITLDIFDQRTDDAGVPRNLEALDPFGYDRSGRAEFPAPMAIEGDYGKRVTMNAHIWPPNSSSPNYKLPGGANSRQGFYFYRNNRLIQGGGWSGLREADPHLSLARLEVDLDATLDLELSLDVRKVEIQLPSGLLAAIGKGRTASSVDFKKYVALAQESYRKRALSVAELPLIPSGGLPAPLVKFLHRELRIKSTRKYRPLKFRWKRLAEDMFLDLDREGGYLFLNRKFRKQLLHGLSGSSADLPVLKCLLFLATEEVLSSERMGSRMRDRIEKLNRILVRAVRFERTG